MEHHYFLPWAWVDRQLTASATADSPLMLVRVTSAPWSRSSLTQCWEAFTVNIWPLHCFDRSGDMKRQGRCSTNNCPKYRTAKFNRGTLPGWFRMAANMIGVQPFSSSQSEGAPWKKISVAAILRVNSDIKDINRDPKRLVSMGTELFLSTLEHSVKRHWANRRRRHYKLHSKVARNRDKFPF